MRPCEQQINGEVLNFVNDAFSTSIAFDRFDGQSENDKQIYSVVKIKTTYFFIENVFLSIKIQGNRVIIITQV